MPQYTVLAGDSPARIAGKLWGNQRYYQLVPGNLHPGMVLDLPDDPGPNPVISQGAFNSAPTGFVNGQAVYGNQNGGPAFSPAPVKAAGLPATPNIGLPAVPGYAAGEKRNGPAATAPAIPAWMTGTGNAPALVHPDTAQTAAARYGISPPKPPAWLTSAPPAVDPRMNQGPRYNAPRQQMPVSQNTGRRGSTAFTPPPPNPAQLPAVARYANPLNLTVPKAAAAPYRDPRLNQGPRGDATSAYAADLRARALGGPGPQDPYRPLDPFEKNTGAVFLGDAINNAISKGDRSLLPPILEDGYWQNMGAMDEAFLESIGYRFQDDGTWRLYNPAKVSGYGGGTYSSGYSDDSGGYGGYGGYDGGGGGYGSPSYGPSQARAGYGTPMGLVNWRIG